MRAQHLVSVSGGKDSTAVYLLAIESGRPFRAVFADTGNEHESVYEYVAGLHEKTGGPKVETVRADFSKQLARHRDYILKVWPLEGIPDEIVNEAAALHEPTGNPYLDLCISKGRFPSRMAQFCTDELKVIPITTQIVGSMLKAGPVLQWIGIRADESPLRAKQPRFNRHESGSTLWRPIFNWSINDVWAQHKKHGIAPNPLYAMGMSRVGCMPCINCNKAEVKKISELFPDHVDRIERWEKIVSSASKLRGATFFPPIRRPIPNSIRAVIDWSKSGRGKWKGQAGAGCTSDLGLCEKEATKEA